MSRRTVSTDCRENAEGLGFPHLPLTCSRLIFAFHFARIDRLFRHDACRFEFQDSRGSCMPEEMSMPQ